MKGSLYCHGDSIYTIFLMGERKRESLNKKVGVFLKFWNNKINKIKNKIEK